MTDPDVRTDLTGRTLITGASSGIGAVAALRLTELGANVVPVGRSPERTARVAARLGAEPLIADYAHLGQVRDLADALLQRCPRIDVLVNNAGGLIPSRRVTAGGHELTFQTNHLAPPARRSANRPHGSADPLRGGIPGPPSAHPHTVARASAER